MASSSAQSQQQAELPGKIQVNVYNAISGEPLLTAEQVERRGLINAITRELRNAGTKFDWDLLHDGVLVDGTWEPPPGIASLELRASKIQSTCTALIEMESSEDEPFSEAIITLPLIASVQTRKNAQKIQRLHDKERFEDVRLALAGFHQRPCSFRASVTADASASSNSHEGQASRLEGLQPHAVPG